MTKRVTVLIEAEFETRDDSSAKAALMRIPGDLAISIEHSILGNAMTGVVRGSVRVELREQAIV